MANTKRERHGRRPPLTDSHRDDQERIFFSRRYIFTFFGLLVSCFRAMRRVPTDSDTTVICVSRPAAHRRLAGPNGAVSKERDDNDRDDHDGDEHGDDATRGCGRLVFAGQEARAGRGLAAWCDWPFDLCAPGFESVRDALADAFAVRLDAWVARIEMAPLAVPARRTDDGAHLSLRHYRFSVVTAPAVAYTSTVWWMPSALVDDDDDVCAEQRDGSDNDRDSDGDDSARAPDERTNWVDDVQSAFCCACHLTDADDNDAGDAVAHASKGALGEASTTHRESTTGALDQVDLATATARLCRRNTVVADAPALSWRGAVDDVIAQLDAIGDSALCVHAILTFRPADFCTGVHVWGP
ncbi:hypothetical protein [Pandoravirus japonicus]|uniref:Uncharacterized protein n=1 Tax=Pandoravirus japonicus TaxID=2823154 RepID=A0A811BRY8_9VIRU|nr:hypothetical protein [Pandoravirus japonicus]